MIELFAAFCGVVLSMAGLFGLRAIIKSLEKDAAAAAPKQ